MCRERLKQADKLSAQPHFHLISSSAFPNRLSMVRYCPNLLRGFVERMRVAVQSKKITNIQLTKSVQDRGHKIRMALECLHSSPCQCTSRSLTLQDSKILCLHMLVVRQKVAPQSQNPARTGYDTELCKTI